MSAVLMILKDRQPTGLPRFGDKDHGTSGSAVWHEWQVAQQYPCEDRQLITDCFTEMLSPFNLLQESRSRTASSWSWMARLA